MKWCAGAEEATVNGVVDVIMSGVLGEEVERDFLRRPADELGAGNVAKKGSAKSSLAVGLVSGSLLNIFLSISCNGSDRVDMNTSGYCSVLSIW